MSGNIILDSMKKKETIALTKMLEAMKLLGKADPSSEKILDEAEKELGIGNKKKRERGEIKFTVPPHDLRSWLDTVRKQGVKPKAGIHYREINGKTGSLYTHTVCLGTINQSLVHVYSILELPSCDIAVTRN
jgi:hypothetical protein